MTAHETIITGTTAVIRALPGHDLAPIARVLLDAAGNRAGDVRTVTTGPGLALAVPVDLARRSGLIHEPAPKPPKTTAAKARAKPRKTKP